jgi:carboxymethylenebutenolidase
MRITLPTGAPAELALPAGAPVRGVVLLPDIMGLRPLFDDLCARLAASHGWAVCAPEPFPGEEQLAVEERQAALHRIDDVRQLANATAAASVLEERGCSPVGVLGFCAGGMYALMAAGIGRCDRAVSCYGMIRVPAPWRGAGQGEPLDWLSRAEGCPVLAIVGGRDGYTLPADVAALRALGDRVTVVVYPEAEHCFVHDPARPAHRPDDAADAWRRAVEFLSAGRKAPEALSGPGG